jgi:cytochrome c biogenesis protein CcmG/thiol:disulfide interchange protein DsbE
MPRNSPVIVALTVLGLFVALLIYGVVSKGVDSTIDDALSRGQSPPAQPLTLGVLDDGGDAQVKRALADDRLVSLDELRGRPIVLNFWASWCDPCAVEAPDLAKAAEAHDDVLFLGVDVQDVRADGREFLREFGLDYPSVRDGTKDTMREWGVTGLPETFFLTADGNVAFHVVGVAEARQLEQGIAAARSGDSRGPQQGGEQGGLR